MFNTIYVKYLLRLITYFAKNSISSLALAFEYIALTQLLSIPFLIMLLKINLSNFAKIKKIIFLDKVTLLY